MLKLYLLTIMLNKKRKNIKNRKPVGAFERKYWKVWYGSVVPPDTVTVRGSKYHIEDPLAHTTGQKCYKRADFQRKGGWNAVCRKFGDTYYMYINPTKRLGKTERKLFKRLIKQK